MYIAELRGKLSTNVMGKEDILTSNVFSFFKYSDRVVFLKPFLAKLGYELTDGEAKNAEFLFWPKYGDGTEPDVVIIVGKYYILFEAKYFSDFGKESNTSKDQLMREAEGGLLDAKNRGKKFSLIAVTKDYNKPEHKFDKILPSTNFKWINWQFITSFLENKLQNTTDNHFTKDLHSLLVKKNLRAFENFNNVFTYTESFHEHKSIFFDYKSAKYRGVFIGFSEVFSGWKNRIRKHNLVFYDTNKNLFFGIKTNRINNIENRIFYEV